jgi:hypothetical protein
MAKHRAETLSAFKKFRLNVERTFWEKNSGRVLKFEKNLQPVVRWVAGILFFGIISFFMLWKA